MSKRTHYFFIGLGMFFMLGAGFTFYTTMVFLANVSSQIRLPFMVMGVLFAALGILLILLHTRTDKKQKTETLSCGHESIIIPILMSVEDDVIRSLKLSLHVHSLSITTMGHIAPYLSDPRANIIDECPSCRRYVNQYLTQRMQAVEKHQWVIE